MELIYDERPGVVAVYEAPLRHCLEMPADCFVFIRHWERLPEGGWNRIEADCTLGKLIAAAPDLLAALKLAAPVVADASLPGTSEVIAATIRKAEQG